MNHPDNLVSEFTKICALICVDTKIECLDGGQMFGNHLSQLLRKQFRPDCIQDAKKIIAQFTGVNQQSFFKHGTTAIGSMSEMV